MKHHIALTTFGFASLLLSGIANAQRDYELGGSLSLRPMYVQNATGTIEDDEQVDEVQIELGATLDAQWQREISQLDVDYEVTQTRYQDETQPDESRWQGQSQWVLGNDATFYGLDISHSVRRFLSDPTSSPTILANSVEREILSVSPKLQSRFGSANTFAISYHFVDIGFDADDTNDAERTGVEFSVLRDVSPTRSASIEAGVRNVDFDVGGDDGDYDIRYVNLNWIVENRTFDYVLSLGYYEAEPVLGTDTFSSPVGRLDVITRLQAGNRVSFFALREASDTSQGNGNDAFFSTQIIYDGNISQRDNTIRNSYGVDWVYEQLCQGCELSITAGIERYDYMTIEVNDYRRRFLEAAFGYDISRYLSTSVGVRSGKTEFVNESSPIGESSIQISHAELVYQPRDDLQMNFSIESDRRESDVLDAYTVNTISFATIYTF